MPSTSPRTSSAFEILAWEAIQELLPLVDAGAGLGGGGTVGALPCPGTKPLMKSWLDALSLSGFLSGMISPSRWIDRFHDA